jgi:hypothetical protein
MLLVITGFAMKVLSSHQVQLPYVVCGQLWKGVVSPKHSRAVTEEAARRAAGWGRVLG